MTNCFSCSSLGLPGTALIWGYFAAAFPYVLPTSLTISDAAGSSASLMAVIIVFAAAAVTVIPSLALLYTLSQKQSLEAYSDASEASSPRQ